MRGAPEASPGMVFAGFSEADAPSPMAMVRPAKLCLDGYELPCLVLAKEDRLLTVRTFGEIGPHAVIEIEFSGGDRFAARFSWRNGDTAALQIAGRVREGTVPSGGTGHMAARPMRLLVEADIPLMVADRTQRVRLTDISQQGAGIISANQLTYQDPVTVLVEGAPPIAAKVQWGSHPRYGLAFNCALTLPDLAAVSAQLHRRASGIRSQVSDLAKRVGLPTDLSATMHALRAAFEKR